MLRQTPNGDYLDSPLEEQLYNQNVILAGFIMRLRRGDCWCDVAISNPMMEGKHSALCDEIRLALYAGEAD